MHPTQMDTLARQRWDELVAHGAAARANRRHRRELLGRGRSALFGLIRRPVRRAPGRQGGTLGRRQRVSALKGLGKVLRESVRTVDRVIHANDGTRHRLAVVLPETGKEGAEVFASRLTDWVSDFLRQRNVEVGEVTRTLYAFPDDEAAIRTLREEFAAVEKAEHPETAGQAPA